MARRRIVSSCGIETAKGWNGTTHRAVSKHILSVKCNSPSPHKNDYIILSNWNFISTRREVQHKLIQKPFVPCEKFSSFHPPERGTAFESEKVKIVFWVHNLWIFALLFMKLFLILASVHKLRQDFVELSKNPQRRQVFLVLISFALILRHFYFRRRSIIGLFSSFLVNLLTELHNSWTMPFFTFLSLTVIII